MEITQLRELTKALLAFNKEALESFQTCRATGEQGDFYTQVKPFADQVKAACDQWEQLAVQWAMMNKPKNLYPMQIRNTAENLQMVSVRAFFPSTSLKKFNSHIQSIEFILSQLLDALES